MKNVLEQATCFIPFLPVSPAGPLARYRSSTLAKAAKGFIEQFSAPGDVVLDLFCQGPYLLREAVTAGRRAVGASVNPINLLTASIGLDDVDDPAQLNSAFTRLADSPKGDLPLHRYINDLYRSACLECGDEGTAVWFAWDSEGEYPYAKAVHCPRCGESQGLTDDADLKAAAKFEHRGLAYHYVLNRAAPPDHPARDRAAELVELYTPRNLSALVDVTIRIESLDVLRRVRAALHTVVTEVFDRGCGLDAPAEVRERPRRLRRPSRFLERNIWLLLESAVARRQAQRPTNHGAVKRHADIGELLSGSTPGYVLLSSSARHVADHLPEHSIPLILVDPPRPDGVFWALCALWACWLWDAPVAHAMRPYLGRRRFDWVWHQEALESAFKSSAHLLHPNGHLVVLFDTSESLLLESVCSAAVGAGYDLLGWGWEPDIGYQLVWAASKKRVSREVSQKQVTDIARDCLAERAEPTPRPLIHAAICTHQVRQGETEWSSYRVSQEVLAQSAFESVPDDDDWCWLADLDSSGWPLPLADRVEQWVEQAFHHHPLWRKENLLYHVYRRFAGRLTPDLSFVRACIDSYGMETVDGWQLREEDLPQCRTEEFHSLQDDLVALGQRLGFKVERGEVWNVHWQENEEDVYLFLLSTKAALGRALLATPSISATTTPCLVFPGGRAELLAHKLRRDRRLEQIASANQWQWIKFRHLRRLIAEELDRRSFERVLGLDPVTGQEDVQIPLIFGGKE